MIQEIKIKNFLSFRDQVSLSFEASSDKFAEDCQVVTMDDSAKTRLLRLGIVYGYNASGKSNLLKAFDFLKFFWSYDPSSADMGTRVRSFRLNDISISEPSHFELIFFVENTKYSYLLELNEKEVILEKLSYYKSTQPIMLFERVIRDEQSDISFNSQNGDKVTAIVKDKITVECLKNMSFFVARDKANASLPLIDAAKGWIKTHLMQLISPQTDLTGYAQTMTSQNKSLVSYLLEFLREADFNVTNITTDVIMERLPEEAVKMLTESKSVSVQERERLLAEKTFKRPKTTFEHTVENESGNASYDFALGEESLGTLKTFGIETALYQAVQNKAFLPIDEIENSLHPKLLEKILFEYLRVTSRSQVLMTTHNDGLLDLVGDLIRKDSIWFTEKDKAGATDLYKLTDFRGVNRLSSIREAYRNKRFGATLGNGK
ncbi:ATP-binding protein [Bacteroides faecis]|uniref:ATP-binding protein n=1 Tax=Bacteroides faecis TaxID=674529 RepID=A0AAW5NZ11_9BACE|nr:ATP-binding protein [Bacteroides faecis]MCS2793804.1 ATP-binding protein [Bacteroides faecis]